MLRQLEAVGINDTASMRRYVMNAIMRSARDPLLAGERVKDTLLVGSRGLLKLETVWNKDRIVTFFLYGKK